MKALVKNYDNFPSIINEFFNMNAGQFSGPLANIKNLENEFELHLSVPGFQKEDFKIELNNYNLVISAEVTSDIDETYLRKEFQLASFKRSFKLPRVINIEKISAAYVNGILILTLPKLEEAKPKEPRLIEIY